MDMLSTDPKSWLVGEITGKATWYRRVASLFPNDRHVINCSHTLKRLAAAVTALPEAHPLFDMVAQIEHVDSVVRERWLDELCLEFSHIAWYSPGSTRQAIQQLMEITDDSLGDWQQGTRLH